MDNGQMSESDRMKTSMEALAKGFTHLVQQNQRTNGVLDNLTEVLATFMLCLEKGNLTFDEFQKNLPEIQAKRMDNVLAQCFENKTAEQLSEVEDGASVLTSGWVGDDKVTLRKGFVVTTNQNKEFLGKHFGDRVVLEGDETSYEIICIYKMLEVRK